MRSMEPPPGSGPRGFNPWPGRGPEPMRRAILLCACLLASTLEAGDPVTRAQASIAIATTDWKALEKEIWERPMGSYHMDFGPQDQARRRRILRRVRGAHHALVAALGECSPEALEAWHRYLTLQWQCRDEGPEPEKNGDGDPPWSASFARVLALPRGPRRDLLLARYLTYEEDTFDRNASEVLRPWSLPQWLHVWTENPGALDPEDRSVLVSALLATRQVPDMAKAMEVLDHWAGELAQARRPPRGSVEILVQTLARTEWAEAWEYRQAPRLAAWVERRAERMGGFYGNLADHSIVISTSKLGCDLMLMGCARTGRRIYGDVAFVGGNQDCQWIIPECLIKEGKPEAAKVWLRSQGLFGLDIEAFAALALHAGDGVATDTRLSAWRQTWECKQSDRSPGQCDRALAILAEATDRPKLALERWRAVKDPEGQVRCLLRLGRVREARASLGPRPEFPSTSRPFLEARLLQRSGEDPWPVLSPLLASPCKVADDRGGILPVLRAATLAREELKDALPPDRLQRLDAWILEAWIRVLPLPPGARTPEHLCAMAQCLPGTEDGLLGTDWPLAQAWMKAAVDDPERALARAFLQFISRKALFGPRDAASAQRDESAARMLLAACPDGRARTGILDDLAELLAMQGRWKESLVFRDLTLGTQGGSRRQARDQALRSGWTLRKGMIRARDWAALKALLETLPADHAESGSAWEHQDHLLREAGWSPPPEALRSPADRQGPALRN